METTAIPSASFDIGHLKKTVKEIEDQIHSLAVSLSESSDAFLATWGVVLLEKHQNRLHQVHRTA